MLTPMSKVGVRKSAYWTHVKYVRSEVQVETPMASIRVGAFCLENMNCPNLLGLGSRGLGRYEGVDFDVHPRHIGPLEITRRILKIISERFAQRRAIQKTRDGV